MYCFSFSLKPISCVKATVTENTCLLTICQFTVADKRTNHTKRHALETFDQGVGIINTFYFKIIIAADFSMLKDPPVLIIIL